jgi:hypothetical protein
MGRISRVTRFIVLSGGVGVVAILAGCSGGDNEDVGQAGSASPASRTEQTAPPASPSQDCGASPSVAPGSKLWRWGDLVVEVPPKGVLVIGSSQQEEIDPPALRVSPEQDPDHGLSIDAVTGRVTTLPDDDQLEQSETSLESVIPTVRICPLDAASAPWPHTGEPTGLTRETYRKISYAEPSASAGVQAWAGAGGNGHETYFIVVRTARSLMYVDADTGLRMEPPLIVPEEQGAFDRFLASVQLVNP